MSHTTKKWISVGNAYFRCCVLVCYTMQAYHHQQAEKQKKVTVQNISLESTVVLFE